MEYEEEVLFQGSTPDGRTKVVVKAKGELFLGSVIIDDNHELESLSTQDPEELLRWSRKQITEAMRRTKHA